MLDTLCDLAIDVKTTITVGRECFRLIGLLITNCTENAIKLGGDILTKKSNSVDSIGSQKNHSRLKKLARTFQTCGDFECQKENTSISLRLLNVCKSFDDGNDRGLESIETLFPKRSEEFIQLHKAMASKTLKEKRSKQKFGFLVDFVRDCNFALGSDASVWSFECGDIKFGEYAIADKLVRLSDRLGAITLNVSLKENNPVATAVDIHEENIRVANFDDSKNTLSIGIFGKCEGMLETDYFNARDDSWIVLTFLHTEVASVKERIRSLGESGNCEAMQNLSKQLQRTAGKKLSQGIEAQYDLETLLSQNEQ